MTDSIYICAGSLCCCLVICSIVRMVATSGTTRKIMSLVISVFSLCAIVSPFYELVKNIDIKEAVVETKSEDMEMFLSEYDGKVIEVAADYINEYVNALLKSVNIENSKIETIMSYDENGGIYIKEMNIHLKGSVNTDMKDIKGLVSSAIGVEPTITES